MQLFRPEVIRGVIEGLSRVYRGFVERECEDEKAAGLGQGLSQGHASVCATVEWRPRCMARNYYARSDRRELG